MNRVESLIENIRCCQNSNCEYCDYYGRHSCEGYLFDDIIEQLERLAESDSKCERCLFIKTKEAENDR